MQFSKTYTDADWDNEDDATPPIAMNWRGGETLIQITTSGTINFDVEQTNADLQNSTDPAAWFVGDTDHAGLSDDASVVLSVSPRFLRFKVNSSTDATIRVDLVQADV